MRFVQEFGSVWAYPDFVDRSTGDMPCPSDFQAMTNPTKTRRQFTALQRQDAVELCLARASPAGLLPSGWACLTAPWPSGSARPASIAVTSEPPFRAS